jgi:two-component system response regulator NreC
MAGEIRLLVVDDHALVRGVLAERLRAEPGFNVVGSAGTANEAIDQALQLNPDIILLDIDMPGLDSFDAAHRLHNLRPKIQIIFLSAHTHDHYIERALRAKASGYLTKCDPPETLIDAINAVASGNVYFSPAVRSRIVVDTRGVTLAAAASTSVSVLTAREIEVLRYIARGFAKKQIARTMGLSVKTVDRHATNLMAKLEIHDRVELTHFAIREHVAEV